MNAGPARRSSAGFSLAELLLTLVALGLAVWVVLRVVDRGTRIRGSATVPSAPEDVLDASFRAFLKDVRAAAAGGLPASEAFRPVGDAPGRPGPAAYAAVRGEPVPVRAGSDQLGLRGALRAPLVKIEPRSPAAGETVAEAARAHPASVSLRAPRAAALAALRTRLAETASAGKTFFFVRDGSGRWAVARVVSSEPGTPAEPLNLVVDFADADARARNRDGAADAAAELGDVSDGGVLDDLVWFVARGAEGRPPDFAAGSDPPSLRYPAPFLAVASAAGGGRWDVRRVFDNVEDLQVGWGLAGAGGLEWRGAEPGSPAPSPAELVEAFGRPRLRALRLALVARAPDRLPRSSGGPAPEFAVPLNGPAPGSLPGADPIGWDRVPQRRIRYDREVRDEIVTLPAAQSAPP